MSIQQVFAAAAADGTSDTFSRNGDLVKRGIFKYSKTGAGTCTLDWKDGETGAVLATFSVGAGAESAESDFDLTRAGYGEISSQSGVIAVTAFIDGL